MRAEGGLNEDDGISKLIFGLVAPGFGIEKSRLAHHGANLLIYHRNGFAQVFLLVSQIGTKSQIHLMQILNYQLSILNYQLQSIVHYQHGIAIATELEAVLDGNLVGLNGQLIASESGSSHHHR